jgi:hypothetical protein
MKIKNKSFYFLTLGLVFIFRTSLAHDTIVHQAITANAVYSASAISFGYNDFLNTIVSDYGPGSAKDLMEEGSVREDDKDAPGDTGGKRSYNHFYDPLTGLGLSDFPPDFRVTMGTNSLNWASISNCPGLNVFPNDKTGLIGNINTTNQWSWQNARGYEMLAFLGTTTSVRRAQFNNMFRALGQVMHLLEDTTQPQHVRNEQHLDSILGSGTSLWHSHIEDYGAAHWTTLNYANNVLDWRGLGFTKMQDFWDRNLYGGNAPALNIDANGGTQLGLAEFCNGNFLGERHIYAEAFSPGDISYYPFPSLLTSTDYSKQKSTPGIDWLAFKNGFLGKRIYLKKTGDGVQVTHHSAVTFFGAKFPTKIFLGNVTTVDDNVDNDYLNILIPKAVEYSAGLLDYYFRGTVGTSVSNNGDGTYTLTIRNTSSQDYSNGVFLVYMDDTNGTRSYVDQFTLNGMLQSLGATNVSSSALNIDLNGASSTTKFTLLYQGNIGVDGGNPLDPVDAGIGIAATTFTINSNSDNMCEGNPANIQGFNWEIPYEPDGFNDSGFISSGTQCSFSGGYFYRTCNLTNSSDCDVTITISAHFTFPAEDVDVYFGPAIEGDAVWSWPAYDGAGTANPQFAFTVSAHSVYPFTFIFDSNGGCTGTLSFNY